MFINKLMILMCVADDGTSNTRIMIFSQYRDSVNEITELLSRHRPLIKVMSFIGQSSAGKTTKGFTQKEQLKVDESNSYPGTHLSFQIIIAT